MTTESDISVHGENDAASVDRNCEKVHDLPAYDLYFSRMGCESTAIQRRESTSGFERCNSFDGRWTYADRGVRRSRDPRCRRNYNGDPESEGARRDEAM